MKKVSRMLLALLLCAALLLSPIAPALMNMQTDASTTVQYYNEYKNVAAIPNAGGCGSMQGMAVGSTYLYTAKINSDNTKAIVTMTNKDNGEVVNLTNSATGDIYFDYLGHANGMDVCSYNSKSHILVATTNKGNGALVRLERSGESLSKFGSYNLTYNGSEISASAVAITKNSGGTITFLIKNALDVYSGSISASATSGTVALTKVFTLNVSQAYFNGTKTDLTGWTNQGFGYHDGKIFVPLYNDTGDANTKKQSVILAYDIENVTGTVYPDKYLSFRITSGTYAALFEIEDCGISSDGRLYFNTNRRKSDTDTNHDGVHYFKRTVNNAEQIYTYSEFHNVHVWKNGVCATCGAACSHSYGAWTVTKAATCTTAGSQTQTCSICGIVNTGTIAATNHNFVAGIVTPPTCTAQGYTTYTCSKCSATERRDYTAMIAHTANVDGKCTVCGKDLAASDWNLMGTLSDWSDGTPLYTIGDNTVATTIELAPGNYEFKIKNGDSWYGNNGTIIDDTKEIGWDMSTTDGNCKLTAEGGTYNFSFNTNTKKLTVTRVVCEHPTHGKDGTCNLCGEAVAHDYTHDSVVTAPTCQTKGYTTNYCVCGATQIIDYTDTVGHTFVNGSCYVCGTQEGFYLPGSMNQWKPEYMQSIGGSKVSITMPLKYGSYEFKLLQMSNSGDAWHGYDGTIANVTAGDGVTMGSDNNAILAAEGGTYTFTLDKSTMKLTVTCDPCTHDSHDTDGFCYECGAPVEHEYVNGTCSCGDVTSGRIVYFDATLSKLSYNGDAGTQTMPVANGNAEGSSMTVHWWVNGQAKGGDVVMTRMPATTVNGHTYADVWKAEIPNEATHVHFYSGNNTGSARTVDLALSDIGSCFYADSSDKAIYEGVNRDGYWGRVFNIRDPEYLRNNDIVDIPAADFDQKVDTMYVGSTFYDYFTDFELNGYNRDIYAYDGEYFANFQNWYPFRHFNQVLSKYYELSSIRVPIYAGHFQIDWNDEYNQPWGYQFDDIAGTMNLYGFMDGKAYGTTDKDQKWFMSVNNGNLNLQPSLGHINSAAQGIVDSNLSSAGELLSSGVPLPYFNETFLRGNNYKNTVVGQVYNNVKFPFTKEDVHGDGIEYWVFDSADTTLQMMQDNKTKDYYLQQITDAAERQKYLNLDASSNIVQNSYGFFPFNDSSLVGEAETYNYGFGARLDIPFDLTEDGKKVDKNGNYKDIIFEFSGDDDVWVFIDGVLVLDIGGCHGKVTGTINFATMEATVSSVKSSGGSATEGDNVVKKFSLNNSRSSDHTLTMFYMERGMWESNMKVTFNFTPRGVTMPATTSMSAHKEWNIEAGSGAIKHPVNVRLQRKTAATDWENVGDIVTLTELNNWSYTFSGIEKYADNAKTVEYLYRVVELDTDGSVLNNGEKNADGLFVTYNTYGDSATGFGQLITNHQIESQEVVIDFGQPVDITIAGVSPTPNGTLYGIGNPNTVGVGVYTTANENLVLAGGTYRGKYGTATIVDGKLRYTPTSMKMESPELISYAVQYTQNGETEYYHSMVLVIPAANIYYDDYFLNCKDSTAVNGSYGEWNWGLVNDDLQQQDRPGPSTNADLDADNAYGFDPLYSAFPFQTFTNARKVTVDWTSGSFVSAPRATFSFTGTGFDVVGVTSGKSGAMIVEVKQGTKTVKNYIVNTYYGLVYQDGAWVVDKTVNNTLYQVPVMKVKDLNYGSYDVTIRAIYMSAMDVEDAGFYDVWLDGIRIYNPAKGNTTAEKAYELDGESNPNMSNIRDLLVESGSFGEDLSANGAVFIEGKDADVSFEEYANYGPNNETYLQPGNGIAFKLRYNGTSAPSVALQIGAKMACGKGGILNFNGKQIVTLDTATNMFYKLGEVQWNLVDDHYESEPILLTCSGTTSGVLSLTDIKIVGADAQQIVGMYDVDEAVAFVAFSDEEVAEYARQNLYASVVPDDGEDVTPDEGENTPDGGDTTPDEGENIPDDGDTSPDDGDNTPDNGDTSPDNGDTAPDNGSDDEDDDIAGTGDIDGRTMNAFFLTALFSVIAMAVLVLFAAKNSKKERN